MSPYWWLVRNLLYPVFKAFHALKNSTMDDEQDLISGRFSNRQVSTRDDWTSFAQALLKFGVTVTKQLSLFLENGIY